MSQVIEGQEDNLTGTRRAMFAGNTATSMQPMDVAEAAYYIQHPDEKPGAEPQAAATAAQETPETPVAEAETPADAPEADPLDIEVTPENASLISQFVTRKEFDALLDRFNALMFSVEDIEGRIERHNVTAPHKIK